MNSELKFFERWEKWEGQLEGYTVTAAFMWVRENAKEPRKVDKQKGTHRWDGKNIKLPDRLVTNTTVAEINPELGKALKRARESAKNADLAGLNTREVKEEDSVDPGSLEGSQATRDEEEDSADPDSPEGSQATSDDGHSDPPQDDNEEEDEEDEEKVEVEGGEEEDEENIEGEEEEDKVQASASEEEDGGDEADEADDAAEQSGTRKRQARTAGLGGPRGGKLKRSRT